ncbi:MAG: site-2 protease family protein [Candidatus Hydrogenedentota bacterium]
MRDIKEIILILPIVVFSIIIHEVAHGYCALLLGDTTAKENSRLTLNPLRHFDPFGAILILLTLAGFFPFGYAKPVPVNPHRIRLKKGMLYVAAAGPLSNFGLLLFICIIIRIIALNIEVIDVFYFYLIKVLLIGAGINGVLLMFNLIPLLPLDGGRILYELLPLKYKIKFGSTERWGIFILLLLLITDSHFNLNILSYILYLPTLFFISLTTGLAINKILMFL